MGNIGGVKCQECYNQIWHEKKIVSYRLSLSLFLDSCRCSVYFLQLQEVELIRWLVDEVVNLMYPFDF